jgi:squalene-associated FAD-dependent desaturase
MFAARGPSKSATKLATKLATKRVAVIGGGWAGCAAAVTLAQRGVAVTLYEAARTLGGRARRVDIDGKALDNGQHILLGAYRETLKLMRVCGIDAKQVLLRLPLQMRYPPDSGGMDFIAPKLPAPFHMLIALMRATGLAREDKMALARFSTTARWMGWMLDTDCSVEALLQRFEQTPRLIQLMWRPLCIAALNTPPERASAQVFLAVLRDSLGARRSASDMLLPRVDLSALLPQRATDFVLQHGGTVHMGATVSQISQISRSGAQWQVSGQTKSEQWAAQFDGIVLATQPGHAAQLLDALPADTSRLHALEYEPITTCYLQYAPETRLDLPFFALLDDPAKQHWGQFVFDRGQLDATQAGLLAVVISASEEAVLLDQAALAAAIARQLATVFGRAALAQPLWVKVISDKRATFACTPALQRQGNASGLPALMLAGDYTDSGAVDDKVDGDAAVNPNDNYPATLESAVRSGLRAAALLCAELG